MSSRAKLYYIDKCFLLAEQTTKIIAVARCNKSLHGLKSKTVLSQSKKLDYLAVDWLLRNYDFNYKRALPRDLTEPLLSARRTLDLRN